jgi:hypothetical protein
MQSLEKYITFLKTLNEAAVLYTDKKIKWISPQLATLLEYPNTDEFIDTPPHSHIHPDELFDLKKNMEKRLKTHEHTYGTWHLRKNDGTFMRVYANGTTIKIQDQTYLLSIFRPHSDIETPLYTNAKIQHDILTPLTAAKGYIELLESHITNPKTQHLFTQIWKNCEKIEINLYKIIETGEQLNQITKNPKNR